MCAESCIGQCDNEGVVMIPGLLAQLYIPPVKGVALPPEVRYQCEFWRKFHPDFQYTLLRLDDIFDLLPHRGEWADALHALRFPAMQSDLARLIWLYFNGGFYSDLKLFPTKPILNSLIECELLLIEHWPIERRPDPTGFFANGFIGCVPNQNIILSAIEEIVRNIQKRVLSDVFSITGARVSSEVFNKYHPYDSDSIKVLHHHAWGDIIKVGSGKYNEVLGHWTKRCSKENIYIERIKT